MKKNIFEQIISVLLINQDPKDLEEKLLTELNVDDILLNCLAHQTDDRYIVRRYFAELALKKLPQEEFKLSTLRLGLGSYQRASHQWTVGLTRRLLFLPKIRKRLENSESVFDSMKEAHLLTYQQLNLLFHPDRLVDRIGKLMLKFEKAKLGKNGEEILMPLGGRLRINGSNISLTSSYEAEYFAYKQIFFPSHETALGIVAGICKKIPSSPFLLLEDGTVTRYPGFEENFVDYLEAGPLSSIGESPESLLLERGNIPVPVNLY